MGGNKLGAISKEEAVAALDTVLELDVECVPETPGLCRAASRWATLLNQTAAHDGFYLALAEESGSSLWTGDGRLVRRAHQIDVPWVASSVTSERPRATSATDGWIHSSPIYRSSSR